MVAIGARCRIGVSVQVGKNPSITHMTFVVRRLTIVSDAELLLFPPVTASTYNGIAAQIVALSHRAAIERTGESESFVGSVPTITDDAMSYPQGASHRRERTSCGLRPVMSAANNDRPRPCEMFD